MRFIKLLAPVPYTLLTLIAALGIFLLLRSQSQVNAKIAEAKEYERPADIQLVVVTPASCDTCTNGSEYADYISKQNVRILSSKTVTDDSSLGSDIIKTYGLTRLPAVLISGEYDKEDVRDAFDALHGEVRKDRLVVERSQPVYFDLPDQRAIGLVSITYLTDSGCESCYDPKSLRQILTSNFGVTFDQETAIDVESAEGRALMNKYDIKQVPAIVLSTEAGAYASLANVWKNVGTVESDGSFVFRKNETLNQVTYKDLATGKVIAPAANPQ